MEPIQNKALETRKYLNFLQVMRSRKNLSEICEGNPFDVSIIPCTACDLKCPYCGTTTGQMDRKRMIMRQDLHDKILNQLLDTLFVLRYFGTGETLLNKNFTEFSKIVRGREIYTYITTHLSLKLSDQKIDDLLSSGLTLLGVSLDGIEQHSYEKYRIGGNCNLVIDNMARLIKRKQALGLKYPYIQWRFLFFQHNEQEIPRARGLAHTLGVDILEFAQGFAPIDGSGVVRRASINSLEAPVTGPALDSARRNKSTPLHRQISRGSFKEATVAPAKELNKKCDWHYYSTYVYPDGGVTPCDLKWSREDDFGDLEGPDSFPEIWNGEPYREARRLLSTPVNDDHPCMKCKNKGVRDKFFNTTVRAILLNAPEWVLLYLKDYHKDYFLPADYHFLNPELDAILNGTWNDDDNIPESKIICKPTSSEIKPEKISYFAKKAIRLLLK